MFPFRTGRWNAGNFSIVASVRRVLDGAFRHRLLVSSASRPEFAPCGTLRVCLSDIKLLRVQTLQQFFARSPLMETTEQG